MNSSHSIAVTIDDDLPTLLKVLHDVRAQWKDFSIALEVEYETIQSIQYAPAREKIKTKMINMLVEYQEKRGEKKWQDIVKALIAIDNNDLASRVPQEGLSEFLK